MDNVFRTPTKDEIKKREEEKKVIETKLKKVVEDAQACLSSTVFAKYRESVKEAREGLIKLMKINSEPDPVKFAFFAKACLVKIDAFDMMLEEVEKDSKKK
jgi:hypothetical protein